MGKLEYKYEILSKYFKYDERSDTCITSLRTGKRIGSLESRDGKPMRCRVSIGNTSFLVHRVIWVLINGDIDDSLCIDHIDGNPWNNKINNLRLVTQKINQRNRGLMRNNTSGTNGVCIINVSNNSNGFNRYVRAYWVDCSGKQKRRNFNIKNFHNEDEAISFAKRYREEMILDSETYTDRHGK